MKRTCTEYYYITSLTGHHNERYDTPSEAIKKLKTIPKPKRSRFGITCLETYTWYNDDGTMDRRETYEGFIDLSLYEDPQKLSAPFKWSMTEKDWKILTAFLNDPETEEYDLCDYGFLGKVEIGNWSVEFYLYEAGFPYADIFALGNFTDNPYAYTNSGQPYEELDAPFSPPRTDSLEEFKKLIEDLITHAVNTDEYCRKYYQDEETSWD